MKMKLSPLIPAASGKIGGHSISNTRNGIVMKTIKQPRRKASHLQSVQRFVTADIANKWQFLTPEQHAAWNAAAINYPYINNLGEPATRNGFQTFCFLNQNRHILELPMLKDPPVFESILKPVIVKEESTPEKFIVQATSVKSRYLYPVFAQIHYSLGAQTFEQTPLHIITLTHTQLINGFDLVPAILQTYATETRAFSTTVKIIAIDTLSGNRDLAPKEVHGMVPNQGLALPIFAYYEFNNNANDSYSNNDGSQSNVSYASNGIVNKSVYFNGTANSYIRIGKSNEFSFPDGPTKSRSFSFCFWFEQNDPKNMALVSLRTTGGALIWAYRVFLYPYDLRTNVYDVNQNDTQENSTVRPATLNKKDFYAFTYNADGNHFSWVNMVPVPHSKTSPNYNHIVPFKATVYIGNQVNTSTIGAKGWMSELTFFKGAITESQFQKIMTANINGETILDIN